jgi:thioredoxin-like negative regulator of GroEL
MLRALGAIIFISALSCAMLALAHRTGDPAIFDPRPYATALDAAKQEKKLLVLVFGAEWCGPCKQMERTTWVDDKVTTWISKHAIALHVDIDKQGELSTQYKVSALPTVVIVKDGKEFDRSVGYRNAEAILKWFTSVQHGARSLDALRAAATPDADGKVNVHAKRDLAQALMNAGEFAASCNEYLWLWDNMLAHQPSMSGVRTSFIANEMERLAAADAKSKARFTQLRDRVESELAKAPASHALRLDWLTLNRVAGDDDRTLAWFDKAKNDPAQRANIEGISFALEHLLIERERFADYGSLVTDPEMGITQVFSALACTRGSDEKITDPAAREAALKASAAYAQRSASVLYASLLAAGRDNEASKVARIALKEDPAPAMKLALLSAALKANAARPEHRAWLDDLTKAGEKTDELRTKLEAALAPRK